ncbi:hypothetical protein F5I97DRAFT_336666 [Phlebopus sp. FC_14]|nr:hypothetical protein F5I97DRAFT_336666 [Phlebopus sp. FC_14]
MSRRYRYSATQEEVKDIGRITARLLQSFGILCCLVGGVACSALGVSRINNDVDMAVMTDEDPESIKRRLVLADSRFYLVNARNPTASYKVLWFRVQDSFIDRSCKVDILRRGTLNIPNIPRDKIRNIGGLPVAHILVVLFLKLQAWESHGAAIEQRYRQKEPIDRRDISVLLDIAVAGGQHVEKESWLPQSFVDEAKRRTKAYCASYGADTTKEQWREIGLMLKSPRTLRY